MVHFGRLIWFRWEPHTVGNIRVDNTWRLPTIRTRPQSVVEMCENFLQTTSFSGLFGSRRYLSDCVCVLLCECAYESEYLFSASKKLPCFFFVLCDGATSVSHRKPRKQIIRARPLAETRADQWLKISFECGYEWICNEIIFINGLSDDWRLASFAGSNSDGNDPHVRWIKLWFLEGWRLSVSLIFKLHCGF